MAASSVPPLASGPPCVARPCTLPAGTHLDPMLRDRSYCRNPESPRNPMA